MNNLYQLIILCICVTIISCESGQQADDQEPDGNSNNSNTVIGYKQDTTSLENTVETDTSSSEPISRKYEVDTFSIRHILKVDSIKIYGEYSLSEKNMMTYDPYTGYEEGMYMHELCQLSNLQYSIGFDSSLFATIENLNLDFGEDTRISVLACFKFDGFKFIGARGIGSNREDYLHYYVFILKDDNVVWKVKETDYEIDEATNVWVHSIIKTNEESFLVTSSEYESGITLIDYDNEFKSNFYYHFDYNPINDF